MDVDVDDEYKFDDDEITAEGLAEIDRIEREAFRGKCRF